MSECLGDVPGRGEGHGARCKGLTFFDTLLNWLERDRAAKEVSRGLETKTKLTRQHVSRSGRRKGRSSDLVGDINLSCGFLVAVLGRGKWKAGQ